MTRLVPVLLGLLLVRPVAAQVRVAAGARGSSPAVVAPVVAGGAASVALDAVSLSPLSAPGPVLLAPSVPAPGVVVPAAAAAASVRPAVATALSAPRRAAVPASVASPALRAAVSAAFSAPTARVVETGGAAARAESAEPDPSAGRVFFDGERARDAAAPLVPSVRGTATPAPLSAFGESEDPRRPTPQAPGAPDPEDRAYRWSKPSRWLVLGGLLTLLSWAPPLLHAATQAPFAPLNLGLGVVGSWPLLIGIAVVAGVAGWPLRVFAHRLAPWVMKGADPTKGMEKRSMVRVLPQLAFAAAVEEIAFRGLIFPVLAGWAMAVLSPYAALAAGAFAAAFLFALIHRYGPVWTRVVGALLYTTALVGSGTLLLPILMHLSFNAFLLLRRRLGQRAS